jgi:hypothetical protein
MVKKSDRFHHDDEHDEEVEKDEGKKVKTSFWMLLGVILLALIPRFYFLFFKADIQTFSSLWYGDVWHHWMIGYLTKEIGLSKGFLRLWDLKGMEYYWGALHPLLLVALFKIFGTADVLIPRLLSLVCGVTSISLVFLIVRRYWGLAVAWGAVIFASLSPIGIFNDASGLTDPLSVMLILWAVYFWPRKAFWAGVMLALAAMNRAEYWLFALGMVLVSMVIYRDWDKRITMFAGWFGVMLLYMKYLVNWTGNAIYPVAINFMATAEGGWFAGVNFDRKALTNIAICKGIFIGAGLGTILVWWKKIKGRWLWFFGLMNLGFLGYMLGFSEYRQSWMAEDRVWVDRLWNWPQMFLGIVMAVVVLGWLPKRFKWWKKLHLGWLTMGAVVVMSQLLWKVYVDNGGFASFRWNYIRPLAKVTIGAYEGGSILLPEITDFLAYALYRYEGIEGKYFVGQMFGPFYYIEGDAYENWEENRARVADFFRENDIRLMVINDKQERKRDDYLRLIRKEPDWFTFVTEYHEKMIYKIHLPEI